MHWKHWELQWRPEKALSRCSSAMKNSAQRRCLRAISIWPRWQGAQGHAAERQITAQRKVHHREVRCLACCAAFLCLVFLLSFHLRYSVLLAPWAVAPTQSARFSVSDVPSLSMTSDRTAKLPMQHRDVFDAIILPQRPYLSLSTLPLA